MYRMLHLASATLMLAAFSPAEPAAAVQDRSQSLAAAVTTDRQASADVLEAPANLHVEAVPLEEALLRLEEAAGTSFAFSPTLIPDGARVTCACTHATVGEAVRTLLHGTSLEAAVVAGHVVIRERRSPRLPVLAAEWSPESTRPAGFGDFGRNRDLLPHVTRPQGTITGQVVDEDTGHPLSGAQVYIEGLDIGVLAGETGRYRLVEVPEGSVTVSVSMIGYRPASKTVELDAGATVPLDFALQQQALALDELVVTGTPGETQRRALGNSVGTLEAAELVEKAPIRSVGDLLNGRVQGVVVMPGTGVVGGGPLIQVRGRGTLSLQTEPLIYIDGVRANNDVATGPSGTPPTVSRLGDLNPEEIESIEVIRGPAAATLYGTEASNGVVQIITKKGRRSDRPSMGVSMRHGANWFMNPGQRVPPNFATDPTTGEIIEQDLVAQEKAAGRPIFRTGRLQGYNVNLSGSTGYVRYHLSAGYDREAGIQPTNQFTRYSGRANLTIAPSDRFEMTTNIGLIRANRDLGLDRGLSTMFALLFADPTARDTPTRGFLIAPPEAWWSAYETFQNVDRYIASVQMNHRPSDWLRQRLTLGIDQTAEDNQFIVELQPDSIRRFLGSPDRGGRKVVNRRNRGTATVEYAATADLPVTNGIRSSTSFGAQYYRDVTHGQYSEGRGFPVGGITLVSGAAQTYGGDNFVEDVTLGMYLQEQVSLNDRLFLTAALRGDDHSAFGENFDLVTYPKLSASWVASEEPFWPFGIVDALKLRAAYGHSGLQPETFAALRTYRPTTGSGGSTVSPQAIGNPDLGPERGEEVELGFEAGLFGGRLGLDFTYYDKRTKDMILLRDVSPSTGFPARQFVNAGEVMNRGIELLVTGTPISNPTVQWDLSLNLATNENEIIDLDPDDPSLKYISISTPPQPDVRHAEGYSIGARFSKRIVSATYNPATGRAENVMCDGGPGAAPVPCAEAPLVYVGRPTPKYEGALSSTFTLFDRVTLHTQLDFKAGHRKFDQDSQARCALFRVCEVNVRPEKFDPIDVAYAQIGGDVGAKWVADASFVKLREVGLVYTFPQSWATVVGAGRGSIQLSARNLHTWTNWMSLDPESLDLSAGVGRRALYYEQTTTPQLASFMTTIRLTW